MPLTSQLFATSAAGSTGNGGDWATPAAATGTPNGSWASSVTAGAGNGTLSLRGYAPQAAILAATGGAEPAWLNQLYVQVTFSLDLPANYTTIDVVLVAADGTELDRAEIPTAQVASDTPTVAVVSFDARASQLTWDDLDGIGIDLDVVRIDSDTLSVDAVGLTVSYSVVDSPPADGGPPPAGAAVKLRLYDQAGEEQATLPWATLTRTVVRNQPGAIAATVPASLLAGLPDTPYLRVVENGVELPQWYLLDDDGDDAADAAGAARPVTIGGRGALACLSWAVTYPAAHVPGQPMPLGIPTTFPFAGATPGEILATLIDRAHARGAIPHIGYDFTAELDSAGNPWPMTYSKTYDLGQDLLKILTDMDTDGWADFRMAGFTLQMYARDAGPLAADRPDVVLRLGQGVTSGPRKRSRTPIRSTILANGVQGTLIEESDAATAARYGRREGYEGRDGVSDYGTLDAVTQTSLRRQTSESEAITLQLHPSVVAAIPGGMPAPGCYVRYDQRRLSPTELEPMRIQSVAWDYGEGSPQVSVELNDMWVDNDVRMARRLDALLNGSSANDRVPQTPYQDDGVAPATPTGFSLVSVPYIDDNGVTQAQVTANWLAPTVDVNGSALDDLDGYRIEWTQPEVNPGSHYVTPPGTQQIVAWSPVVPGAQLQGRIAAVDRFSNWSPWSDWVTITTGADETPPAKPSTPQVDNWVGLLRSYWDGGFLGGIRPSDFASLEVHVSSVSGFTPDPGPNGTLIGTLFAAGYAFADTPYGATRFVRFVAVDVSGNRSEASDQASGATGQVVSADVFDGAIGSAKLADLAVINAKIGDLAVNNAKIGDLDVGKLTAGVLNAAVTISGTISTAADPNINGGVQINGLGIYAWDGVNPAPFVSIDKNGATITGGFRTGIGGRRVELGLTSSTTARLDFFAPNGGNGFVQSYTEQTPGGLESLQVGMIIPGQDTLTAGHLWQGWNRLNINSQAWWNAHAWRHEVHFTTNPQNGGSGGGFFEIIQDPDWTGTTTGVSITRFAVGTGGLDYWGTQPNQSHFGIGNDGTVNIDFTGDTGTFVMIPGGGGASGQLQMFTPGGYGALLRSYVSGTSVAIEARSWDGGSYVTMRANDFSAQSDARGKREIRDAAGEVGSFVEQVLGTRVRKYVREQTTRRAELDKTGRLDRDGRGTRPPRVVAEHPNTVAEIGLIAQEAPAQIVHGDEASGFAISLYQMTALLWGAVRELAERLDEVEKNGARR